MKKLSGAVALLSAAALFVSVYLTWHALTGAGGVGCMAGSQCSAVLDSRWSLLLGRVPVSLLAAAVYAVMLCSALFLRFSSDKELEQLVPRLFHVLAGAMAGSAVWFSVLQAFVLHAFCAWCMTAHAAGLAMAVLIGTGCRMPASRRVRGLLAAAGIGAALLLAGVQWATTPRSTYVAGYSEAALPLPDAELTPFIGNPDAPHVCWLLFDYQCNHCQKLHGLVQDLASQHGDSVCFRLCTTPLSPACNPYIPAGGTDTFAGSCDLARMAEALWLTDTAAYRRFDAWLFAPAEGGGWRPRPVAQARQLAEQLAGAERLEAALEDARLTAYFDRTFELFGRTTMSERSGIPRLVCGSVWVIPEADDAAALRSLLATAFGIVLE